jgi:hypothetical protein
MQNSSQFPLAVEALSRTFLQRGWAKSRLGLQLFSPVPQ